MTLKTHGSLDDTIVAPATATGGALAIVRLSGPRARAIAAKLTGSEKSQPSHRLVRATWRGVDNEVIDEGMMVQMHAPHSYTGDDVVELHLHGSPLVVDAVMQSCLALGARLAEPGEFTLRAFLRGRLDLSQAEAVGDLIAAQSETQRQIAARQLQGALSRAISAMLDELEAVLAAWHVTLDFPEQVGEVEVKPSERQALERVRSQVDTLIEQARTDVASKRHYVLCGAPNVGKSSLLNALVGEQRALVNAAPGTTRDAIEVELAVGTRRLSLWDTAGLRDDAQGVEREGIELGQSRALRADGVIWLLAEESRVWPPAGQTARTLLVVSKADLLTDTQREELDAQARARGVEIFGFVSAQSREGLAAVRQWLGRDHGQPHDAELVVVHERHVEALRQASVALRRAQEASANHFTLDVQAMDVEQAVKHLGAILGRDVDLEIIDRIFSGFCLGK